MQSHGEVAVPISPEEVTIYEGKGHRTRGRGQRRRVEYRCTNPERMRLSLRCDGSFMTQSFQYRSETLRRHLTWPAHLACSARDSDRTASARPVSIQPLRPRP